MKKIFLIILSLAFITACERKIDEFSVSSGTANFSTFVAIGNSTIAGYADAALYHNGQKNSLPNLIAGQLQTAGSGTFVQPMVTSEYGIAFPGFSSKLILAPSADCKGTVSLGPVESSGTMDVFQPVGYAVNNFGVPGAKSFHVLAAHYGDPAGLVTQPPTANPYFVRFAQSTASSVLYDAMSRNPTFFLLALGENDVLSYALSGGLADTITSGPYYNTVMNGIVQQLTANGAKGVIANVPDITAIPFFTTIPYNGLYLERQTLVDSINYFMANLFQLPDLADYHVGYNPFLIPDPASLHPAFKVRKMVEGEKVLLTVPQDSLKCAGWGIISSWAHVPTAIPKQFILTLDDIDLIEGAIAEYNGYLSQIATNNNLALVDLNSKMKDLQKGISWNGVTMSTTFVTGGAFSLDGIHLCPRGNALAANFYIQAINAHYGSHIPLVDISKYPGNLFP
jgi:hypothetical protein